jgi:hypothetical protein
MQSNDNLAKATRPLQYVAFTCVPIKTKMDGAGFIYLAVDAYLDYAFSLGAEQRRDAETVVRKVYELTEHPDFTKYLPSDYTIVMEEFPELSKSLEAVVSPSGGSVLYNKALNNVITNPVLRALLESLKQR